MILIFAESNSEGSKTNWSWLQSLKSDLVKSIIRLISEIYGFCSLSVIFFILHSCLMFFAVVLPTFHWETNFLTNQVWSLSQGEIWQGRVHPQFSRVPLGNNWCFLYKMCWPQGHVTLQKSSMSEVLIKQDWTSTLQGSRQYLPERVTSLNLSTVDWWDRKA